MSKWMNFNQLKTGAYLSYVIIVMNILIGLIYTPFMLRMMGKSEYGLYSLAASVIAYLTILDAGFASAIIRYTAAFRSDNKLQSQWEMFGMFLRLYTAIGVIALFIGVIFMLNIDNIFDADISGGELVKMRIMIILMSFNLAFTFPLSIFGAIITAYENFVFQRIVNLIRILLNPIIMVFLLLLGHKAIALVVVTTVLNLVTLLINRWYCFNKLHIKVVYGKFDKSLLKEISSYSFWIFLNVIMDKLYWSTGQFILGIYQGTAVVAVYAVALQLKQMYFMFSSAISGVFLPKITGMITNQVHNNEISSLFIKVGRIQYIMISFIISGFILFGRQFIAIWAGEGYEEVYSISLVLFFATLIPLIQNLGITILKARKQLKFRSITYVLLAMLSVILSIPFAKLYGGIGCAIATSIALILGQGIVINVYYAKKIELDIIRFWSNILRMSICPILLVFIGWFVVKQFEITSLYKFILAVTIFAMVYVPIIWKYSMNQYERDLIYTPISRMFIKFLKV